MNLDMGFMVILSLGESNFLIENDGRAVKSTDYFDTQQAGAGDFFATWNAGALRLLVPDRQQQNLAVMQDATRVIVTQGFHADESMHALEILFMADATPIGYLTLELERVDHGQSPDSHGKPLEFRVYTRAGCVRTLPGVFRWAPLPCLQPMTEVRVQFHMGDVA